MLKNSLKSIPAFYYANAAIKARMQERKAASELAYYRAEAVQRGITVLEGESLAAKLKARLDARGIRPTPKGKCDLRIFLAYPMCNWEAILPAGLAPLGSVIEFEWRGRGFDDAAADWPSRKPRMHEGLLKAFRAGSNGQPFDVAVVYMSGHTGSRELLSEIGRAGAVVFNFCWDDKLHFRASRAGNGWTGPAGICSAVDLNLTNAPECRIKYMVEGALAMFWPEAAQPEVHRPHETPFEFDVSFVGARYGWRPGFINALKKRGIDVATFGKGWDRGPLSDDDMIRLYSRSRINLGFAGIGYSKRLMCLKGRDFEVPLSGGLYLTQNNPELGLVYEVGREIVVYDDVDDCAARIRRLLEHPDEAAAIRAAGRARALRDHTWEKRFEEAFRVAGLLA